MRELVVISGKGGTGKTSISASLFALADNALIVDCDVDAANLHLLLNPNNRHQWSFFGGNVATIDPIKCNKCNKCKERCRFDAISSPAENKSANYIIDPISCEGCGVCVDSCPQNAIELHLSDTGKWFIADTRLGSMIHARLNIAAENSGKLVSLIRHEAKAFAGLNGNQLIICDGPPGIGCPVIASITLADFALIVTEATLSGLHDLIRVIDLCQQMKVKTGICINKADINLEISNQIEVEAQQRNIPILGRISYDDAVTKAQIQNLTIVENNNTIIAKEIKKLWAQVTDALNTVTI
ncbi:MAG: ATP-binding protein [Deltaproteobacteria bacterium]|nr:ATP-binding protein [Deltaproteobacteria bacterium]